MTSTYGITGFGGYVPRLRIQRSAIASAHAWMAPSLRSLAKCRRAFTAWDEDSVTMAVEAARDTLGTQQRSGIGSVQLASTTLPYADLQHSPFIAAALNLGSQVNTLDIAHSQRAGVAGLLGALRQQQVQTLYVAADNPRGRPASAQELAYGAGAAAFTLGTEQVLAHLLGSASVSALFVDHFRPVQSSYEYVWEERWVRDEGYMKLVPQAVQAAMDDAGIQASQVNHFILASPLRGIAAAVARSIGIDAQAVADGLEADLGYCGTAHPLLQLAHVLENAQPGQLIVLAGFGQGCDALVLQVSAHIGRFKPQRGISGALADGIEHNEYLRFLSYADGIELEWGMRAEKNAKAAHTEQYRNAERIAGFLAGKSPDGTVQFPQLPYSVVPGNPVPRSQFEQVSLADVPASILTITADWLTYHPAPPLYVGFVQFDNGARLLMETVDVGPAGVDVGTPVRMVFRIKEYDKVRSYGRYFWKATPISP